MPRDTVFDSDKNSVKPCGDNTAEKVVGGTGNPVEPCDDNTRTEVIDSHNLRLSQKKMKTLSDKTCKFEPAERVLLLFPVSGSVAPKCKGLYSVLRKDGDLDYIVATPDCRITEQRVHIHMMKPFFERKLLSDVSPVLLSASSKVNSSHIEEKKDDCLPDHNSLNFVNNMKLQNQRVLRWSLSLQEYNLNIRHIKGKDNLVADYLSRV